MKIIRILVIIQKCFRAFFRMFYHKLCYLCGQRGEWICADCETRLERIEPGGCRLCSRPLISESELCTYCRQHAYSFKRQHSLFLYTGRARELIFQYKFNRKIYLADFFARALAEKIKNSYSYIDWIVPVPSGRLLFRKKNHVTRLAELLQTRHGLKVGWFLYSTARRSQKSLDYEARLENLRGRIHLRKRSDKLKGCSVLLIDDIFTTGASSQECADVLIQAGAEKVEVLTLALD